MIASTSPAASIGSRTGKPTFSMFTLVVSMPVTLAKLGHCAEMTSAAGAASSSFRSFRRGDAAAFARDDGRGGLVKSDEHGLDLASGIGIAELDQAIIGDAHVVAAGRKPVHGFPASRRRRR